MTQYYLIFPAARRSLIFTPIILTLCLMYSCRAAWKNLKAVHRPHCSARWFQCKAVLWFSRKQVAYDVHAFLAWVLRGGFLTSFRSSAKAISYSCSGTLFGAAMGQMDLPLWYLIFCLYPLPLSSPSIIRWSVETIGSLMMMLYKYFRSYPRMQSSFLVTGLPSLHILHVQPLFPL